MWFHRIFALHGRTPEGLTFTHITSTEVRYWHRVLPWPGGYYSSLGLSIGNIHHAPAAAHSLSSAFILVCVGVGIVHVVVMWPREGMREVQRHHRMRICGDTLIKGPPVSIPYPIMRHQRTCPRSLEPSRAWRLWNNHSNACARQAHRIPLGEICPPSKHPLGCWVCCVQCRCKCVVSCCCLCAPSSFLIRAWDRQWRSFIAYIIKFQNYVTIIIAIKWNKLY